MKEREVKKLFHKKNKGLVLDGRDKRLTIKQSCEHMAIIARS
jgi:hypothetical protein